MFIKMFKACAITALAAALPACSSSGPERVATTTSSLAELEALLDQGEAQTDAVLTSMDFLSESEDMMATYKAFDSSIEALEDTAEDITNRRAAIEAQAEEHAVSWQQEILKLSGERAREISEQRRREYAESVDEVGAALDELREAYDPFVAKLKDVRLMLSNDLTENGVQAATPVMNEARDLAEEARERADEVREAIEDARSEFSR